MPFNGSGVFNRVRNWVSDAAAAIKIRADLHDSEDDNLASGLSNTICRDGQSTISADIPWNGKKITGLGNPVNPQDAATKSYMDAIRAFASAISLTGNSTGVAPTQVSTALMGFTEADMAIVGRQAGSPASSIKRIAINDKADGTGNDLMAFLENGGLALPPNSVQSLGTVVMSVLSASGTWTKQSGLKFLEVMVQAGGGAGAGPAATGAAQTCCGGGGGGGGWATAMIPAASLSATVAYVVGAAGIVFSGATGGSGGVSNFGAYVTTTGGVGGTQSGPTGGNNVAGGGAGGIGGGTLVQWTREGQIGGSGITNAPAAGNYCRGGGGSSMWGPGSQSVMHSSNGGGEAGASWGSGGSGQGHGASQAARPGSAGAQGLIVIKEYY